MHIKSYRYVPKRWLMLLLELLFLTMTVGLAVVAIQKPVPSYVSLDIVLMRQWGLVVFCGVMSVFFMFPLYRSFLRTRLLLGRDRILIPKGSTLRERIEVLYADITGLRVVKEHPVNNRFTYLVRLYIDYRVGSFARECNLPRAYFRSRRTFATMCACLAENVRAANPDIVQDPTAIQLAPRFRPFW